MKKTPQQKDIMKDHCCRPFFWEVASENVHFMIIRNWLTGEHRVCRKE